MKIEIEVPLHPTEGEARVRSAVSNLFPKVPLSLSQDVLHGSAEGRESAEAFRDVIFARRILDTVRAALVSNLQNDRTHLLLHKQAAAAGKAVLASPGESPLGELRVQFFFNSPAELNWLAPETAKGRPIDYPDDPKPLYSGFGTIP